MHKSSHNGFTLIEILVALLIYVFVAAAFNVILKYVLKTTDSINKNLGIFLQLQTTLTLLEQDLRQVYSLPTKEHAEKCEAIFLGDLHQINFMQLKINHKRNTTSNQMQRVIYRYHDGSLLRMTLKMDTDLPSSKIINKTLIKNLENMSFSFGYENQFYSQWPCMAYSLSLVPSYIKVMIQLKNHEALQFIFPIGY